MNDTPILTDLYVVDGEDALYDLSDGSLSDDPIATVMGFNIYSAESLLNRIDGSDEITIKKVHMLTNMIKVIE